MGKNRIAVNCFEDFIHDMSKVVEQNSNEEEKIAQVEQLVGRLITSIDWLPVEKREGRTEGYARHSLYHDPLDRFEVLALVWQPGQKTPLHDHDGTWGVEGVVSGKMKIINYIQVDDLSDNTVKLQKTGSMIINQLSTGQLLPPADCHILEVEGREKAITIHVYGKKLKKFKVFDPLEDDGLYKVRMHHVAYT